MLLTNLSVTWMRNHGTKILQGTSFSLAKRASPDIADITASMPADRASRDTNQVAVDWKSMLNCVISTGICRLRGFVLFTWFYLTCSVCFSAK